MSYKNAAQTLFGLDMSRCRTRIGVKH